MLKGDVNHLVALKTPQKKGILGERQVSLGHNLTPPTASGHGIYERSPHPSPGTKAQRNLGHLSAPGAGAIMNQGQFIREGQMCPGVGLSPVTK